MTTTSSPIRAAYFYHGGQNGHDSLAIGWISNGRWTETSRELVSGKRDARVVACSIGAKPWNF